MTRLIFAALGLAATQALACTNQTPWPREPQPWATEVRTVDAALVVPEAESRAATEDALASKIHAIDMQLAAFEADSAKTRAALRCEKPEPAVLAVLHQRRLELGAMQFELATAKGDRWLDARGMLRAAIDDYEDRVDRATEAMPPGLASADPESARALVCAR